MDFSKLTTDNFYIFITIAGFSISIYCFNYSNKIYKKIKSKIYSVNKRIVIEKKTIELIEFDIKLKKNEIFLLLELFKFNYEFTVLELNGERKEEFYKIIKSFEKNKIKELLSDYRFIKNLSIESHKMATEKEIQVELLNIENYKLSKLKKSYFSEVLPYTFMGLFFGLIFGILGLICWYEKYQKYQDEILKIKYKKETTISFLQNLPITSPPSIHPRQ